jgi:hypothetical protein
MSFEELLNKLQQGSNRYYLTTQELNVDRKTGVVQLYASPGTDREPKRYTTRTY